MYIIIPIDKEIFKPLIFPGVREGEYEISNYGHVISIQSSKIRQIEKTDKDGYKRAPFMTDEKGVYIHLYIHVLVAWNFVEGYDEEAGRVIVNHKDTDTSNNYYENLEWATHQENVIHSIIHGNFKQLNPPSFKGIEHPMNKYSEELIRSICLYLERGWSNLEILDDIREGDVKRDKCLRKLIRKLRRRECWKHVVSDYNY